MMWFSFSRAPDSLCDYKVSKTAGILVPWVFTAYAGSVRGLCEGGIKRRLSPDL